MVADFSENKDYGTYIIAANNILLSSRDISFLCIGYGDDTKYKQMVSSQNKDKIFFLGLQENVENIMNICDIGILITNNKKHGEGISNALLEFSALGKPVIATVGGGNVELVKQGITGFLINPESAKELEEKIKLLLSNEELRTSFGENSEKRIKDIFSIDMMVTNFISIYKEVISK